jgi:hypothetical protein
MKFEGFNTPKCSLLAPSNIDDPIFELASCNKTPAKWPPPPPGGFKKGGLVFKPGGMFVI